MNEIGTPLHKRVKRAEKSRDEWKVKAIERREESEKFRKIIQNKDEEIQILKNTIQQLNSDLKQKNAKVKEFSRSIDDLKKKRNH